MIFSRICFGDLLSFFWILGMILRCFWVVVSNIFFNLHPYWGNDPIWLIFCRWVETTNKQKILWWLLREVPRLYPRILTQLCPRTLSRLCPRPTLWSYLCSSLSCSWPVCYHPHPTPPFCLKYPQVCLAPDLYVIIPTPPHPTLVGITEPKF